ncbi:MAG: phosphomannomutase/phosphoglucomutase [Alphaproteobacteria bacterium]|nr:phosphomannomutase/phosphoglucomutase [Alphaproteobacteria bacterium]
MKFSAKLREMLCLDDEEQKEFEHPLPKEIFRDYDIRGIFGKTLFPEHAYYVGRAFGTFLYRKNLKKICVGNDCRNSSDTLADQLIWGLTKSGMEVIELGICHTPMMYYTVNKFDMDAGIMITGSHNPAEYNGFKFMLGKDPFYGDDIKEIERMIRQRDFIESCGREVILNDIFVSYIKDILDGFKFSDDLRVAWDIGNGATSNAIREIVNRIPGRHHILFEDMDGNFPNRQPDPTVAENISYLRKFVSYNKFDIGFAFDSDGDRLCVVNSDGQPLYSDQVFEIFAADFLKKNPGAQVISDVKSCNRLFQRIKELGGSPIMEKVGHTFIKARMKSSGALLAGEMSGHFFFKDRWFGFDDGIYAALRCLEILSENKDAFSNLPYGIVTPEIRISCPEDEKFRIIEKTKEKLQGRGINFADIDGVRVSDEKGWWLIRASNTQNAISLRAEAEKKEYMKYLLDEVVSYLKPFIKDIEQILKKYKMEETLAERK